MIPDSVNMIRKLSSTKSSSGLNALITSPFNPQNAFKSLPLEDKSFG